MPAHSLDHPSPNARRSTLIGLVVLYATGIVGGNLGVAWLDEHPAIVLGLNARNRNLFGSVPYIDPASYAVIGFARIMVVGIVFYLTGRFYGDRIIEWVAREAGQVPPIVRWTQAGVRRFGWALLLFAPGSNIVCLVAGQQRLRMRVVVALLTVGSVAKLAFLWVGGRILDDQIEWFLDAVSDYQWYVVGGLFAITILHAYNQVRKLGPAVIEEIEHPTDDDAGDTADTHHAGSAGSHAEQRVEADREPGGA